MAYIHELPSWPNFTWDARSFDQTLAAVRHKQGKHLGKMEALGFALRSEASMTVLARDIVSSSAIGGLQLDADEVRASLANKLGLNAAGLPKPRREVERFVALMLDATQKFEQPLTVERLFGWHAVLVPIAGSDITVGGWRMGEHGPMQVDAGPTGAAGEEREHFQAPSAERLPAEMKQFLTWFNQPLDTDPVLKAAVAHLWFLTIRPFDDGNGRIARAIADLALARADGSKQRFYSMSAAIEARQKMYYYQLKSTQRGSLDITSWLAWFLDCLDSALDDADTLLASVLSKARLWQRINTNPVSDRQREVLTCMLGHDWTGHLNSSKYAQLTKCSPDTALRDIKELVERGVLLKNESGGRSTSYRLAEVGAS